MSSVVVISIAQHRLVLRWVSGGDAAQRGDLLIAYRETAADLAKGYHSNKFRWNSLVKFRRLMVRYKSQHFHLKLGLANLPQPTVLLGLYGMPITFPQITLTTKRL